MMKLKGLLLLFLGSMLLMQSCEKDVEIPIEEEVAGDVRDRFVGNWTVSEDSKLLGKRNYTVKIEKSPFSNQRVLLQNFYLLGTSGDTVQANISAIEVKTITVPDQTVNNNFIGGSGELVTDNKIDFNYRVDDGNDIDTVTAVFVR